MTRRRAPCLFVVIYYTLLRYQRCSNFAALTSGSPITVAINDSSRREAASSSGKAASSGEVWVVQTATDYAAKALDEERSMDALAEELLVEFGRAIGREALPATRSQEAVVWVYGDTDYHIDGGCAWLEDSRLAMAGDWAFNGR